MKGSVVGGEGKEAEIDGGYFGGYVKPANLANRRDRRFARNQNGKRKVWCCDPGTQRKFGPGSIEY
jgi:hypothetical protein